GVPHPPPQPPTSHSVPAPNLPARTRTTICQLPVARICHLAYIAIRRREGTDPWSVGTTSARPFGPHARSRTAPFFPMTLARPLIWRRFSSVRAWLAHIALAEQQLAEHRTSLQPPSLAQSSFCRPSVRCASRKNLRPIPMHSRLDRAAIAGRPASRDQIAVRSRR